VGVSLLARWAAAEDFAFGGSLRGHGGVTSAGASLGAGVGMDEPDPLKNASPRAEGSRGAGGFGSELFVAIHDIRIGLDATILFSDAYRLSYAPLANGFTASATSATTYDFDLFVGRMFEIGGVRPYADLRFGVGILQTPIRLEHPVYGFIGSTQYDAVRFLFGPRTGAYIPLAGPLYLDAGVEVGLLGFSRVVGYAGFGGALGTATEESRSRRSRDW
jgi:hypothetical protein